MSDVLNEQLSALLDGELPPEQTALLLKRLGRESELAARLASYRLCGEVLRGGGVARADLSLRVSAAIAAEPPLSRPTGTRRRFGAPGWLRPAAGLAVAASVGMLAVLVLQRGAMLGSPVAVATVAEVSPARAAPGAPPGGRPNAGVRTPSEPASYVTPAVRPELGTISGAALTHYVVAHSEASSPLAGRSVLIHLIADEPAGDTATR